MRLSPWASSTYGRSAAAGGRAGVTFTRSTIETRLVTSGQREGAPQELLDRRLLDVRRRAQGQEAGVLARAPQQSAAVVQLVSAVEEDRRVTRKRADADDVLVVDGVARDLPHHAFGARR